MECNKFFINILAALILLMYISKLNHNSSIAILVTILIAYQATADINLSICIGCIMGSVYVGLQGNNKILKLEGFKSGKKKSKNKSRKVVENMNTPDNTTIAPLFELIEIFNFCPYNLRHLQEHLHVFVMYLTISAVLEPVFTIFASGNTNEYTCLNIVVAGLGPPIMILF